MAQKKMAKNSEFPYGIRVKRLAPSFIKEMERRHEDFRKCFGFKTNDSNISKMMAEELRTMDYKFDARGKRQRKKKWMNVNLRIRV